MSGPDGMTESEIFSQHGIFEKPPAHLATGAFFRRMVQVCCVITAGLGVLGMIGWSSGLQNLASFGSNYIPMSPVVALALILLGGTWFLYVHTPEYRFGRVCALASAFFVLLIALLNLIQFLTDVHIGIEEFLAGIMGVNPETYGAGPMPSIVAASFFLACSAMILLLLASTRRRAAGLSAGISFVVILVNLVILLGYLYGSRELFGGEIRPVALPVGAAFVVLGLAIIATVGPDHFPLRILVGTSVSALLRRSFLLVISVVILTDGLVYNILLHLKVNVALLSALSSLIYVLPASIVVTYIARVVGGKMDRVELEREQALEELRIHENHLEELVEERVGEIKIINEQLKREISDRKGVEERLRESEIRYRSLFEQSPDGILIVDPETTVAIEFNEIAHHQLGYTQEEFKRLRIFDYEAKEKTEETKAHIQRVLKEGRADFETLHRTKDGKLRNVLVTVQTLELSGRIVFHAIFRDITERKLVEEELARRAAELARSNAELEQFAYIASHDLQEPLRTVINFTQLLAENYKGKLDKDADEFIEYTVDASTRMKKMIDDLLMYSRVSTRGKPFAPTDCETVLNQALDNLKMAIEESGAIVTRDPLPTVMADASQIAELLQNLISNAIKFRREQPPRVHVSAEQNENQWVFSVRDNGIGIAPEYFERIFMLFQRLHSAKEYPGTGIGLAICKKIVERHGGRIWVESEPAKGSIFYFSIPARRGVGRY
ncbi:Methanogenesis regulatory histidine kinase FilI [uncultured archaeon]|nr:Methanogenesis regulatory histidine kinase FilI [uncultured archaeon]